MRTFTVKTIMKAIVLSLLFTASINTTWAKTTFRYPEDARPSSLMPFFADNMSEVRIVEFIFESLITLNKRGDVEGVLATAWQVSPDNMSITFDLRPGVVWHDGKPFSAQDVVFTVQAAKDPKTIFNGKSKYDFISGVQELGGNKVKFTFKRPEKDVEKRFTFKIIPKHAFSSPAITRTDRFLKNPIGTGPYKITANTLRSITLSKNEKYWSDVQIDEIIMQHTPDKNEQINLLNYAGTNAGIHAVIFIPPKNMSTFENSDTVVLEPYHTVSWWYLAFNHNNPMLKDLAVREAFALAINREELLEAHLGQGDLLTGPFTESSPFYNFDVEARQTSVDEANQKLEAAGYKKAGEYRKKGKDKLSFKFVLDKEMPRSQQLFLSIQGQLKKVGIEVLPEYVDLAKYKEEVFNKKKFDLTMNIWSFKEIEDVYPLFRTGAMMNFIQYSNAEVDQLLDESLNTKDHKKYKELMMTLHQVLYGDLPYLFLWSLDVYSGLTKQLSNIFIQPYYYFTFFKEWAFK